MRLGYLRLESVHQSKNRERGNLFIKGPTKGREGNVFT